jgi:hypothetical protein
MHELGLIFVPEVIFLPQGNLRLFFVYGFFCRIRDRQHIKYVKQ